MKKLSKEQIEKRKRIKQYLLRSLHIVSYVLSVLFIVVCIVVGVQSCKTKNNSEKVFRNNLSDVELRASVEQGLDFQSIYYLKDFSNNEVPLNFQQEILNAGGRSDISVYENVSGPSGGALYLTFYLNDCYIYNDSRDEFVEIQSINVQYLKYYYSEQDTTTRYRLYACFINTSGWTSFIIKASSSWADNVYNFVSYKDNFYTKLFFTDDVQDSVFLDIFYYKTTSQEFFMPNRLNYYYWISDAYSGGRYIHESVAKGLDIAHHSNFNNSVQSINLDINVPYFISNGKLYNCIRLNYICLGYNGGYFVDYSQTNVQGYISYNASQLSNWGLFDGMAYINKDTYGGIADSTIVLLRQSVVLPGVNNTSPVTCYTSSCSWLMDEYRQITFLTQLSDYTGSLSSLQLLTSMSLINDNTNAYTSLFNLLSMAFSSLKSIFDIQVMPMLSIGVLLFAPLLIGLVVVIFRMVKK